MFQKVGAFSGTRRISKIDSGTLKIVVESSRLFQKAKVFRYTFVKIKNNGQKPNVPILAGYKREEHPPCQPTPRRVALTSEI